MYVAARNPARQDRKREAEEKGEEADGGVEQEGVEGGMGRWERDERDTGRAWESGGDAKLLVMADGLRQEMDQVLMATRVSDCAGVPCISRLVLQWVPALGLG